MEREFEGDVVIEVCVVVASSQIVVRVGAAPGGFKGPLERLMRKKHMASEPHGQRQTQYRCSHTKTQIALIGNEEPSREFNPVHD